VKKMPDDDWKTLTEAIDKLIESHENLSRENQALKKRWTAIESEVEQMKKKTGATPAKLSRLAKENEALKKDRDAVRKRLRTILMKVESVI